MTSRQPYSQTKRLGQDSQERHALDKFKADDGRPVVEITGNGTKEEIPVEIPIGVVSYPADKQDIEVIAGAQGDDVHAKLGRLTQPEKTRYKPKKGEHGMQDPADKNELVLFTDKGHRVKTKKGYAISAGATAGLFEITKDGTLIIRAKKIQFAVLPVVGATPKFDE